MPERPRPGADACGPVARALAPVRWRRSGPLPNLAARARASGDGARHTRGTPSFRCPSVADVELGVPLGPSPGRGPGAAGRRTTTESGHTESAGGERRRTYPPPRRPRTPSSASAYQAIGCGSPSPDALPGGAPWESYTSWSRPGRPGRGPPRDAGVLAGRLSELGRGRQPSAPASRSARSSRWTSSTSARLGAALGPLPRTSGSTASHRPGAVRPVRRVRTERADVEIGVPLGGATAPAVAADERWRDRAAGRRGRAYLHVGPYPDSASLPGDRGVVRERRSPAARRGSRTSWGPDQVDQDESRLETLGVLAAGLTCVPPGDILSPVSRDPLTALRSSRPASSGGDRT
jgi:hypothetical protein